MIVYGELRDDRPRSTACAGGGRLADRISVTDQFCYRTIAGEPSGCKNVIGELAARKEAGSGGFVSGLIAGHVQQEAGRGPSWGNHQQVAKLLDAVGQLDASHFLAAISP
jgi:hypothetical protein